VDNGHQPVAPDRVSDDGHGVGDDKRKGAPLSRKLRGEEQFPGGSLPSTTVPNQTPPTPPVDTWELAARPIPTSARPTTSASSPKPHSFAGSSNGKGRRS